MVNSPRELVMSLEERLAASEAQVSYLEMQDGFLKKLNKDYSSKRYNRIHKKMTPIEYRNHFSIYSFIIYGTVSTATFLFLYSILFIKYPVWL